MQQPVAARFNVAAVDRYAAATRWRYDYLRGRPVGGRPPGAYLVEGVTGCCVACGDPLSLWSTTYCSPSVTAHKYLKRQLPTERIFPGTPFEAIDWNDPRCLTCGGEVAFVHPSTSELYCRQHAPALDG